MKSLALVRLLGEERSSFKNDQGQTVNFMKVALQSSESMTETFSFNITDETLCTVISNVKPYTEGYAVLDITQNGKYANVKLKGWKDKNEPQRAK